MRPCFSLPVSEGTLTRMKPASRARLDWTGVSVRLVSVSAESSRLLVTWRGEAHASMSVAQRTATNSRGLYKAVVVSLPRHVNDPQLFSVCAKLENICGHQKAGGREVPQTALASGQGRPLQTHKQCYEICKESFTFRKIFPHFYSLFYNYYHRLAEIML